MCSNYPRSNVYITGRRVFSLVPSVVLFYLIMCIRCHLELSITVMAAMVFILTSSGRMTQLTFIFTIQAVVCYFGTKKIKKEPNPSETSKKAFAKWIALPKIEIIIKIKKPQYKCNIEKNCYIGSSWLIKTAKIFHTFWSDHWSKLLTRPCRSKSPPPPPPRERLIFIFFWKATHGKHGDYIMLWIMATMPRNMAIKPLSWHGY